MRPLILITLALATLAASAAEPAKSYPLWDGQETIAEYAKRTGLEPTKTLDLGNGVKLELVLIPAGKFTMGTPYASSSDVGTVVFWAGFLLALAAMFVVVRPTSQDDIAAPTDDGAFLAACHCLRRFSLARVLVLILSVATVAVGVVLMREDSYNRHAEARYRRACGMEKPSHVVTLTKPFYIGKYEVTQEQYERVMESNPSSFRGPHLPVENVMWGDAEAFCKRISNVTGASVRLPTEAEWEFACRAGTKTDYYSGDDRSCLDKVAWYDHTSGEKTHPVGLKAPNLWNVFDMHGNVYEWCADLMSTYEPEPAVDPKGPLLDQHLADFGSERRIFRGGCWGSGGGYCRSAERGYQNVSPSKGTIGLRVVMDIEPRQSVSR